uniref:SCP domain-containing protein n=2 Tax=Lutzomyia longipalpis TaxID=7200 RepID=A0A1B0CP20_LUTLO
MALNTSPATAGGASSHRGGIEMVPLNKQNSQTSMSSKQSKRPPTKKLQFSTPECSVTPISAIPGNRMLLPGRKREEAIVMANLRKRVAACDLTRRRLPGTTGGDDINANETNGGQGGAMEPLLDNRPLLPKVSSKHRDMNGGGEESPKMTVIQDKDFILDCLCWHNEYRARHAAPALSVSTELCEWAQNWANHLASTNEFYYRSDKNLGQNLFCCPVSALVTDLTGQEVASYWYSTVRRYNYFKEPRLLHTNVNAVWRSSRYFGVGKATSKTGKIFVVANYFPPGNVVGAFQQNVLPPIMDQEGAAASGSDADNNPIVSILKSGNSGCN